MFGGSVTRVLYILLVAFLVASGLASVPGPALPTPGLNCQATGLPLPATIRYVPEPENTNDFIGFFEAEQCLRALDAAYPDWMEIQVVSRSHGHADATTGIREPQNVYVVEVTNEKSAVPFDDKIKTLFMLSIHGNEKGAREGGLRVIEDYVRDIGWATLPAAGHPGTSLRDLLDQTVLLFLFPNPDGWVHDEAEFFAAKPGTFYERQNANGTDLNRQFPTSGWQFINPDNGRIAMSEPEPRGYAYALANYTNIAYAADIHGMLNPADGRASALGIGSNDAAPSDEDAYGHFILGLISAGRVNPQEMLRGTRLAEILSDRLNTDPFFAAWSTLPSTTAWGGEYYSWSTVWDTIGYTDSGISGDYFLQDSGLNAPGMNFEMAYNHILFDSAYAGPGLVMNTYHVQTTRHIVRAYLEASVTDVQTSIEVHGRSTAYLTNPTVVTDKDDAEPLRGWAAANPFDDPWDISHIDFEASPEDYFRDLRPFLKNGDSPARFDALASSDLTLERLQSYDNLVVAGSAVHGVSEAQAEVLKAYVEQGGNLVLTDQSMLLLDPIAGLTTDVIRKYAGMTLLVDRAHPFAAHSVKLSRQTYEPVPIGYSLDGDNAPVWFVPRAAFEAAGGETVGTVPREGSVDFNGETNLGRIKIGSGTVSFLGALLPDPTEEFYHPYGLESYATTYFGNLILYNMIGAEQVFEEPPIVLEDVGHSVPVTPSPTDDGSASAAEDGSGIPAIGPAAVALATVVALGILRFRRRD